MTQVNQTGMIAFEHFDIGKHMVAERNRLSNLHMREARHDDVVVLFSLGDEHLLKMLDATNNFVDFTAQIEADIGCNLIVAGAAGVKTLAGVTNQCSKSSFNIEMHVFKFKLPFKLAGLDFFTNLSHASLNVCQILL